MTGPIPVSQKTEASRIVVVGLGAVGSHLVGSLGRMEGIGHLTLVDPDHYDTGNVASQDIDPSAAGLTKVRAQAERLGRICPEVQVTPITADVRRIPVGRLRASVIFSCVDSRAGRQAINTLAWRLGIPWVDAGVDAGGLLARVRVFRPDGGQACLECGWDERDYELIEQDYPCKGAGGIPYSTRTPGALAALAASLQALEGRKVLAGDWAQALAGREVVIDANNHRHYVSSFKPNARCSFDHRRWNPRTLDCAPQRLTLGQAFELGRVKTDRIAPMRLELENRHFTRRLTCLGCRTSAPVLRLVTTVSAFTGRCDACGAQQVSAGFDLLDGLSSDALTPAQRSFSLWDIGLRSGDIYSIRGPSGSVEFEIPCANRAQA